MSVNVDRGFELTISCVKVWRRVIIEEHSNQDPIERTDRRHPCEADFTIPQGLLPTAGFGRLMAVATVLSVK